ncbi:hypothetical protein TPS_02143 [Trichinella pseudospiralis]
MFTQFIITASLLNRSDFSIEFLQQRQLNVAPFIMLRLFTRRLTVVVTSASWNFKTVQAHFEIIKFNLKKIIIRQYMSTFILLCLKNCPKLLNVKITFVE